MRISNINYLDIIKILLFTLLIFFWDLRIKTFDTRLLLLLFVIFFDYKILKLDKYKKILIYFSLLFLFISVHYYFNLFLDDENFYHIPKNLIYIFLLTLVILFNLEFLRNNLRSIITLFIFTYVLTTIIFFIINGYNQKFNLSCTYTGGWHGYTKFLFSENSHFAMVSVASIIFYFIGYDFKKNSIIENIFIYIFLIMALINFSGVFLVAIILSLSALLISNYKYYSRQGLVFTFLLFSFAGFFIFYDKDCNYKIIKPQAAFIKPILEKYSLFKKTDNFVQNYIDSSQNLMDNENMDNENMDNENKEIKLGMSGAVLLNSINIAKTVIFHRPLGWGLDRYEMAYNQYAIKEREKYDLKVYHSRLFDWNLNSKDGSNNLAKLVTEFGLFSFILLFYFIYFSFSKKATFQEKSFLIPLVLTQLLRGAGYYNGGFLICIILMFAISLSRSHD